MQDIILLVTNLDDWTNLIYFSGIKICERDLITTAIDML